MSSPLNLDRADWKKVAHNAAIFSAPAILIALGTLQAGGSYRDALVAVYVWLLNTATDIVRKYVNQTSPSRDTNGKFTK